MTLLPVLPIDAVLPELLRTVASTRNVVLHAPPGAGKTTRVPLALLRADFLHGGRVLMLEPRRLAARAAATYMSKLVGDEVGGTIGYRVRLDSRVSSGTRVEVVTEGVLTRMLQDDPALDGVGAVIFDEFHERSIHADTGLALALQSQSLLRPDLRILVMSATLDVEPVSAILGDAAIVRSEGRAYPVDTIYLARPVEGAIESHVARTIAAAHDRHAGDILAFLPGAAEIRRTAERLHDAALPPSTRVIPLHGDLPREEQDRAIAPSAEGTRKVVLATSIAETSLTIEGVRIVVDSGLMRIPRFSARSGMTQLVTVPVTRDAADQRRGRAGRVSEGTCYRLWTEAQHGALLAHRSPEILDADLAPLALDLALWGVADPTELRWIDAPPASAFSQARELLQELDALDAHGTITTHGRSMAKLATHPRLAHMLLASTSLAASATACELTALLNERDVLRSRTGRPDPDVRLRLIVLRGGAAPHGHEIDRGALQRARTEARHWKQRLRVRSATDHDDNVVGVLIALAYPDRIAQQRSRGRFQLRNGRVALVDTAFPLAGETMIAAGSVGGAGRETHVYSAAPVAQPLIERHFARQIEDRVRVEFDDETRSVRAYRERMLGALVLTTAPARDVADAELSAALLDAVRHRGLDVLPWTSAASRLRERLAFLHAHDSTWPNVADDALLASIDDWLAPWIGDARRPDALRSIDMHEALLGMIGWERRGELDRIAPTHVDVPSGSRIAIDYSDPHAPVLAVRLQEMFGAVDTPRIAEGRVPLTLHLLSPARRPVQVTRDLASFWRSGYFDVRKDLRGRYPKHYWPDDPLRAEPTGRTRPRRP